MSTETEYVVEMYTRFVHDSRWICLQPGTKLSMEQAEAYGLVKKSSAKPKDKD
jgi:hypothetical protein